MQIAQRCYANSFQDPEAEATHLQAFPKSTLAFHWPRLDFDQLLCVRLVQENNKTSQWSGGFPIDDVDSFHVTGKAEVRPIFPNLLSKQLKPKDN